LVALAHLRLPTCPQLPSPCLPPIDPIRDITGTEIAAFKYLEEITIK